MTPQHDRECISSEEISIFFNLKKLIWFFLVEHKGKKRPKFFYFKECTTGD